MRGILATLFAAELPAPVAKKKHEEMMEANSLCYTQALRVLTVGHLESLGVPMDEALMIVAAIQADPGADAGVDAERAPAQWQHEKAVMRGFPVVGASGWPTVREFEAFSEGFEARIEQSVSAETM